MRLKDKVVVITGAGLGMGRAMATRFAGEGAQGNIADKGVAEGLSDLAVKMFGRSRTIIPVDGGWMAL